MAQRRMFSLQIVDTDAFLDMPPSSQLLYFHLSMRADDEGFIANPKKIMKVVGSADDDIKILIAKRFILTFKSGVVVIKHWLIHNTIRMDRFKQTKYEDEKNLITTKENGSYTELATKWQPNGNQLVPQVKLSKDKLSKDKIEREEIKTPPPTLESLVLPFKGQYSNELLNAFYDYWSEPDKNGKERWKSEKFFEISRRLATWYRRDSNKFTK